MSFSNEVLKSSLRNVEKNLTFYKLNISVNAAAEVRPSLKLLPEFEPWIVSVCISKFKIHFPVYLLLISSPFPDLAESVMCLFLFGLAGTWLAFYKQWLNLIQGQFSFQSCWGSQQALKPIFTVTDHLGRVTGKAGQEVTEHFVAEYLLLHTPAFPAQVCTKFNKTLCTHF